MDFKSIYVRQFLFVLMFIMVIIIVAENSQAFAVVKSRLMIPAIMTGIALIYLKYWGDE